MMYKNKLAVAIKSAGSVLREFNKDEVYVPFGSEYTILIKNLNNVRALVSVSIDGDDVGEGTQFAVNGNDEVELERFIKNGNFNKGNRFKFIERSDSVEEHRGVGIEDGLVRVEFQFEKPQPAYVPPIWTNDSPWNTPKSPSPWDNTPWIRYGSFGSSAAADSLIGGSNVKLSNSTTVASDTVHVNYSANVEAASVNDAGITVPGSISDQKFYTAAWFPVEEESHVIVLKMLGQTKDNVQVRKPVTVKAKPKCVTCGRTNKAASKFCTECGTSLQIV